MNLDGPTAVGSDFNAAYLEWHPRANRQHGDSKLILDWMSDNAANLASSPGVSAYRHGDEIQLVLSNIGALADIEPDLHSCCDHSII